MTQEKLWELRAGFETACIDGIYASNLAYKLQFQGIETPMGVASRWRSREQKRMLSQSNILVDGIAFLW